VSPQRPTLHVIGRRLDPEDHRLRDFLTRADQPYEFYERDSLEALELLARHGIAREHDAVRERTLEITFLEPGAEAYVFTFG